MLHQHSAAECSTGCSAVLLLLLRRPWRPFVRPSVRLSVDVSVWTGDHKSCMLWLTGLSRLQFPLTVRTHTRCSLLLLTAAHHTQGLRDRISLAPTATSVYNPLRARSNDWVRGTERRINGVKYGHYGSFPGWPLCMSTCRIWPWFLVALAVSCYKHSGGWLINNL